MQITPGTLLQKVNNPADIKKLSREELQQLCDQLRQYIIDVVSEIGRASCRERVYSSV